MDMFMENAHMNCHGHEFSCMIMVMPRVFAAMLHVYIYIVIPHGHAQSNNM